MDKGEKQHVAWVTGAGSGIGRALSLRLARTGWKVAVSSRGAEALDSLAAEVPGQIFAYPLDVTDQAAVAATAEAIAVVLGPIDRVVFNAGSYRPISARDFDADKFRDTIDVNLNGTANGLAAVLPPMIARGKGQVAVVASMTGFVGLPTASSYGASKAALNNLCEALQPDLARYGVSISVINPGFVDTPLTRKNDFPMPFLIDVEEAVDHIVRGLDREKFEIVFPWQMALLTKFAKFLPHGLLFAITRKMVR